MTTFRSRGEHTFWWRFYSDLVMRFADLEPMPKRITSVLQIPTVRALLGLVMAGNYTKKQTDAIAARWMADLRESERRAARNRRRRHGSPMRRIL